MTNAVLFEKKGAVGEIILNRPEHLNAMNFDLIEGLAWAVNECRDPSVRAVVMRGNGRCFSAGGDIKAFNQMIDKGMTIPPEMPDKLHVMVEELRNLEKPVLASIHGAAAGAGTPLALSCDLVIASEEAIFNVAYARIGLTPDGSSTYFVPRHVGMKKAFELFMTLPTLN
ncbi:MAG: enoyl-CoA hydratase/isomerase family protein, partial [Deltaproteobacteria bacterium]|nr:enoyl-CoA hydratase/isomerase family protein [Deltaproteobacteria bacterium]